jgi:hypothetical protein
VPIDKFAARVWRGRLRDILNRDWDPIGGCPPDEYDIYRDGLSAMIRDNASDDELLAYLEWAESDNMGFDSFDRDRGRKVIAALRKLGRIPWLS